MPIDGLDSGQTGAANAGYQRRRAPGQVHSALEDVAQLRNRRRQFMVTSVNGRQLTMHTVGAKAVNQFASLDMSMELLQPVPDAIGELLEYTVGNSALTSPRLAL